MTGNWHPHNVCLWHNRGDVKKLSAPAGADQKHVTALTILHTNTFRECEYPSSTEAFYNGQSYMKCFRVLLYAGRLCRWWKRSFHLSFSIQQLTRNASSNSQDSQGQNIFSLNVIEDIAWALMTAHELHMALAFAHFIMASMQMMSWESEEKYKWFHTKLRICKDIMLFSYS